MQSVATLVRNCYLSHFEQMTLEYRLHFASRLFAWSGDADAEMLLRKLRDEVLPATHEARLLSLESIRDELTHKDYNRDVNDYARRKPYFEKYPDLLLLHNALFRIRHWYCIYGVDERQSLYRILPRDTIHSLLNELTADIDGFRTLSTYAINTFYLYDKLYQEKDYEAINLSNILTIGKSYDLTNKSDIQMLIYLYTHCILGETLFYWQPIQAHHDVYRQMLEELEAVIGRHYDDINLDNKFEFLVCANICSFTSTLKQKIYDEANRSINNEGYIVDVLNNNRNPVKQSLMMSEHRNVLFIMSNTLPKFNNNQVA